MDEREIREGLKLKGFERVRKKYGQKYMPIISADKNGMRIWVEIPTGDYQTCDHSNGTLNRTSGKIENFLK